jgi:hypothetical protein
MNAKMAVELSNAAKAVTPETRKLSLLVMRWHRAIRSAAQRGERSVHEKELDGLRCPISPGERRAALELLRADGFSVVEQVQQGNLEGAEVSW